MGFQPMIIDKMSMPRSSLKGEANFERHLPMGDVAVLEIAARFAHFKPAHVADGFSRTVECIFNRLFNSIRRRANKFNLFVNVICHARSVSVLPNKTRTTRGSGG